MRHIIILLIAISSAFCSHAQILKINKNDLAVDTAGIWRGSTNLNLNLNNRNATAEKNLVYTGIQFSNNITYLSEKHAYIIISTLNYFRITDGPLISTGSIHGRINFLRRKVLSYETFSQVQYDDGRQMPLRYLFGGGIRIRIIDDEEGNLYAGIGIMNEFERWEPFDREEDIEKRLWKSTNYLSGTINVSESFNINIVTYYQMGYDDEDNIFRHRISGDITFNARITGRLALTTNFTLLYESDPIIKINPMVYSLTNGFRFNF